MANPQAINETFEETLVNDLGVDRYTAQAELSRIQAEAQNLIDQNDPEINRRFDLLEGMPEEEFAEGMNNLIKEIANNNYSEEEQLEIANEVFNIIGFNLEKNPQTNQCELKLTEPQY